MQKANLIIRGFLLKGVEFKDVIATGGGSTI